MPDAPPEEDDGKELNEGDEGGEGDGGGKADPGESEGDELPPEEDKGEDDTADDSAKGDEGESKDEDASGGTDEQLVTCTLDGDCDTKNGQVCSPMYSDWEAEEPILEGSFCIVSTTCYQEVADGDRSLYADCPVPSQLVHCGAGAGACDAENNEICIPMLLEREGEA